MSLNNFSPQKDNYRDKKSYQNTNHTRTRNLGRRGLGDRIRVYKPVLGSLFQHLKQPRCPPTGEWVNKPFCIQTRECSSALKTNELSSHEETQKMAEFRPQGALPLPRSWWELGA